MLSACAILPSATCLIIPHFSTIAHKLYDFREKATKYTMCVSIFLQLLYETLLNLRKIQRDIVTDVLRYSCKAPTILARL
jgi:hypothetical protein